jgi:hypothetical protein
VLPLDDLQGKRCDLDTCFSVRWGRQPRDVVGEEGDWRRPLIVTEMYDAELLLSLPNGRLGVRFLAACLPVAREHRAIVPAA